MIRALEQLSDILCGVNYFDKAYKILTCAAEDIKDSPDLHELIARIAFSMEKYTKCIFHNKEAQKL